MATAVWTEDGHAYTTDLEDPATRAGAGVGTYYLGWGSSTAALSVADSALTEHPEARVACTITQEDTAGTALDDHIRYVAEITATGTRSVAEAGIFTASVAGLMLYRVLFPAIPIESGDRLEIDLARQLQDSSE